MNYAHTVWSVLASGIGGSINRNNNNVCNVIVKKSVGYRCTQLVTTYTRGIHYLSNKDVASSLGNITLRVITGFTT